MANAKRNMRNVTCETQHTKRNMRGTFLGRVSTGESRSAAKKTTATQISKSVQKLLTAPPKLSLSTAAFRNGILQRSSATALRHGIPQRNSTAIFCNGIPQIYNSATIFCNGYEHRCWSTPRSGPTVRAPQALNGSQRLYGTKSTADSQRLSRFCCLVAVATGHYSWAYSRALLIGLFPSQNKKTIFHASRGIFCYRPVLRHTAGFQGSELPM